MCSAFVMSLKLYVLQQFFYCYLCLLFQIEQRVISSQLEMNRLSTGTQPRVITALTTLKQRLFKYESFYEKCHVYQHMYSNS